MKQRLHDGRRTALALLRRPHAPLLALLITSCAVTPALGAEGAPTQAPTVLPPTLQALQQKMAQIRFNTARVSVRTVLGDFNPVVDGELVAGGHEANRLITTTSTALSYSPRALLSTSTLDSPIGKHTLHRKVTERVIGKRLYIYVPSLARSDGGRPWLRSEERLVAKPHGANEGEPLAAVFAALSPALAPTPQPGEHGTFVRLSEDLAAAQSIHEIASPTALMVDGQPVTGFAASIPVAALLAPYASPKQLKQLIAAARPDEKTVALEVFIAPSGVPVRTTVELGAGEEGVGVQEDILGLEVPVLVTPPPARQTITQAQLDKLESKRHPTHRRRRSARASATAAALAAGSGAPAALAEGSQSPPVAIPPALHALEQKMEQIRFNTARISDRLVLGEASVPVGTAELGSGLDQCKSAEVTTTGVVRRSPLESATTGIFVGYRSREIEIGATTYTYKRSIAKYDGGRPWVRRRKPASKPERGSANDTDPSTLTVLGALFGSSRPRGSQGPFARLVEDLDGALSIQEIGPATVDRQQATEYTASLSAAKLLAGRLTQKQREMARGLEAEPVTLELFIAPSGLPVRTTVVVGTGKEGLGEEEDFLALGIPVSIHAPPARETISQTKLDQLQKRRFKEGIFEKLTIGEPTSSTPHCPEEEDAGPVGVRRAEPG